MTKGKLTLVEYVFLAAVMAAVAIGAIFIYTLRSGV